MPTYPVINLKNKETKELRMTMKEYDEWKKENPDWDRDWSQGCAGQSTEFKWTGEAKSNGWNEVLDRASKQPGANVSKNRYYGQSFYFHSVCPQKESLSPLSFRLE